MFLLRKNGRVRKEQAMLSPRETGACGYHFVRLTLINEFIFVRSEQTTFLASLTSHLVLSPS
jgi:hypothetical protein